MYMRAIAYIAIVALAATPVMGCTGNDITISCWDGNGRTAWENTQLCMKELGNSEDCYCWGNESYYAIANQNYVEFKACCQEKARNPSVTEC